MKLKYNFTIDELAGAYCAMPIEDTEFIGLIRMNSTAKNVFDLLCQEITFDEIISILGNKYDVSHDLLVNEVTKIINTLDSYGIIAR